MGPRRMPAAELDISPDLVRRLLRAQHPDLAELPVEVLANGWDNAVFGVGDRLLARLPRRAAAAGILVHEQRWLPGIAPRLPLPVPVPVRVGQPDGRYPWPWSIVPYLPGRVAAERPPADPRQAAVTLGGFLGALHAPAAADAPVNPFRGIPLADRTRSVTENLDVLGDQVDRGAALGLWEAVLAAPGWAGPPAWLHGDLHPANILVHAGRISAVIDFGDMTSGDPATDLSVAWMLLPARCHDPFKDAYLAACQHAAGDDLWVRARGWGLVLALVYLAHSADNPQLAEIGAGTLGAVLG